MTTPNDVPNNDAVIFKGNEAYKREKLVNKLPLNTPFGVDFHPTTFCNLKCIFCFHSSENSCYNDIINKQMSMDTFKNAVDGLKKFPNKIKALHFCGCGEPLMNKNVYEMIDIAKKADIAEKIDIVTNGLLLSSTNSEKLISSGVDAIRISVNGLSDEDFKTYTGVKVDFNNYVKNLAFLHEIKKDCTISIKILDFMVDTQEKKDFFFNTFASLCDDIRIENYNEAFTDTKGKDILTDSQLSQRGEKLIEQTVCSQPFFKMEIDPDGDILPCAACPPPLSLGNVNESDAYSIFNSKKANNFRMIMADKGYKQANPLCSSCNFIKVCSFNSDYIDPESAKRLTEYYKKRI